MLAVVAGCALGCSVDVVGEECALGFSVDASEDCAGGACSFDAGAGDEFEVAAVGAGGVEVGPAGAFPPLTQDSAQNAGCCRPSAVGKRDKEKAKNSLVNCRIAKL